MRGRNKERSCEGKENNRILRTGDKEITNKERKREKRVRKVKGRKAERKNRKQRKEDNKKGR